MPCAKRPEISQYVSGDASETNEIYSAVDFPKCSARSTAVIAEIRCHCARPKALSGNQMPLFAVAAAAVFVAVRNCFLSIVLPTSNSHSTKN